jgi:hypothetical protein
MQPPACTTECNPFAHWRSKEEEERIGKGGADESRCESSLNSDNEVTQHLHVLLRALLHRDRLKNSRSVDFGTRKAQPRNRNCISHRRRFTVCVISYNVLTVLGHLLSDSAHLGVILNYITMATLS